MNAQIAGILPVLSTPFDEHGAVDCESFAAQAEAAIGDGAHGLVMFGLASEYYKLADEERRALTSVLIKTVKGRVPVVLAVNHHCTELAIRQAVEAEQAGADAIMILPPFFLNPPVQAILSHIEEVATAVRIPSALQYAPAQTGIPTDILANLPVTIIKIDAAPSTAALRSLPAGTTSLVGYMGLDLPDAVSLGCSGCMPTASLARSFVKIWKLLKQSPDDGRREHMRLLPLLEFLMQSVEFLIAAEKQLLLKHGIIRSAYGRKPCAVLDHGSIDQLFSFTKDIL